jgi:hypothetical protein
MLRVNKNRSASFWSCHSLLCILIKLQFRIVMVTVSKHLSEHQGRCTFDLATHLVLRPHGPQITTGRPRPSSTDHLCSI